MAGTGGYALPIDMPLVAKKPLKRKMSAEAKAHFDYISTQVVSVYTDKTTGDIYAKVTDSNTGVSKIVKCEQSDED